MKKILKLLVVLGIIVSFNYHSVLAEDIDLDAGELIFSANCAACHAGGNNVIVVDKTLKIDVLESNGMNSVDAIKKQVTFGKNSMPAFGDRLSSDDIINVANFVLNQASNGW